MEPFERRSPAYLLFRTGTAVTLEHGGEERPGFGLLAPAKGEAQDPQGALRHPTGALSCPLYRFTGWLQGMAALPGDTLRQGEERYTVLRGEALRTEEAGRPPLCLRLLLERQEGGDMP